MQLNFCVFTQPLQVEIVYLLACAVADFKTAPSPVEKASQDFLTPHRMRINNWHISLPLKHALQLYSKALLNLCHATKQRFRLNGSSARLCSQQRIPMEHAGFRVQ